MSKDLVVLVADVQQEKTVEALLTHRIPSLGIRTISFDIFTHPRRDPGVYRGGADFLASFIPPAYEFALLMLDREWDGSPGAASTIRDTLRLDMIRNGWQDHNCQVIVPDPEIESWVWSRSDHVPRVLRTDWQTIRGLAHQRGYWLADQPKPHRPKELLEFVLKQRSLPRSSALFQELARHVGLNGCQDAEFQLLRETLRNWFTI